MSSGYIDENDFMIRMQELNRKNAKSIYSLL